MRRHVALLLLAALFAACFIVSCSGRHDTILSQAERIATSHPDSALKLLRAVDPAVLTHDSAKAKYYYVAALAHDAQDHILLSDSMIGFSNEYYKTNDLKRSIRSATLLAGYKFNIGEKQTAMAMLDSLSSISGIPDSLLIDPLRSRVQLWAYDSDNESRIKRLLSIDRNEEWQSQYKFWLYFSFLFNNKSDSALVVINDLIDSASRRDNQESLLTFRYEKVDALMELSMYEEGMSLLDSLMSITDGDNTAKSCFLLWKSLGSLNMKNHADAAAQLHLADSLASGIPDDERRYFNSFATLIHTILDYHSTGKVSFIPFSRINNSQRDILHNEQAMRQEAARRALEIENQRLILKSRSDNQVALLIIVSLSALIISGLLIFYAINKRRNAVELAERNETLRNLVDESKSTRNDSSVHESLRRAMLQQLDIIKMVAEAPTEQNCDMLRKISSVKNSGDKSLVNWQNVYAIIDNLYSGFHSRLCERHGSLLSDKEQQIIALMVAGFSTKEISVITGQTPATIYVRKSSIRKKLGIPEKEDILTFLRQD